MIVQGSKSPILAASPHRSTPWVTEFRKRACSLARARCIVAVWKASTGLADGHMGNVQ